MLARTDPEQVGTFSYPLRIYSADGSRYEDLTPLVDTGSLFTWVPSAVLERLGIRPAERLPFKTATGETITRHIAETVVAVDGHRGTSVVVFGEGADLTLLGRYTLDGFLLKPDAAHKRMASFIAPVA